MLCSGDIYKLINEITAGLAVKNPNTSGSSAQGSAGSSTEGSAGLGLSPSELLVIGGIIADVLQVESVLVNKDQEIEIVLAGSLKRKTELDKMLDQIGSMSFDEILKALISRT